MPCFKTGGSIIWLHINRVDGWSQGDWEDDEEDPGSITSQGSEYFTNFGFFQGSTLFQLLPITIVEIIKKLDFQ